MNHRVNSVTDLYLSTVALNNYVIVGSNEMSAATIIRNLKGGIEVLKDSWQGIDAAVQINKIINVYNSMIKIKNELEDLCVEISKIASNYRTIQRENGALLEELPIIVKHEPETTIDEYKDTRDIISIMPKAIDGKAMIDVANNSIEGFITETRKYFNEIMENWTQGPNRDEAIIMFDEFVANSSKYKELLNEVSYSISSSLNNYKI